MCWEKHVKIKCFYLKWNKIQHSKVKLRIYNINKNY